MDVIYQTLLTLAPQHLIFCELPEAGLSNCAFE